MMRVLPLFVVFALLAVSLHAQTIDDGIMMAKHSLFTGDLYSHESWDRYWEGDLKRVNGNIGTITTRTNIWFANYGITSRLNVIASMPYVWTRPSQGVLQGMNGLQDLTLAAKFSFLERRLTQCGSLRAIGVVSGGVPLTDYTPDFQPLSIGTQSKRVSWRFTLNFQSNPGWFLNDSTAYTWRSQVALDRPYYYTDGQLFLTDQVDMPNAVDHVVSAGYLKRGLMTAVSFSQQRTLGGGDIRRQDMPFVSNRVNFSKIGVMVMSPIPKLRNVGFQFAVSETIDGRNVGQATTFTSGFTYRYRSNGGPTQ